MSKIIDKARKSIGLLIESFDFCESVERDADTMWNGLNSQIAELQAELAAAKAIIEQGCKQVDDETGEENLCPNLERLAELQAENERKSTAILQQKLHEGTLRRHITNIQAENQSFRSVMAIIHRDGGHYVLKHGHRKASKDTIEIIGNFKVKIDKLQAENEKLKKALGKIAMRTKNPYMDNHLAVANEMADTALEALKGGEEC